MLKYGFSANSDIPDLKELWKEAFDDSEDFLTSFFSRMFIPDNTVVCRENGKVVSALYLLPCDIKSDAASIPAQYIYAAATSPKYRNRGIMSVLLQMADEEGERHGYAASVLLPGNESLYNFYAKKGYMKFFKKRSFSLDFHTPETVFKETDLCFSEKLRNQYIIADGSVLWNEKHLFFVKETSKILIYKDSYAVFSDISSGESIISEFFSNPKDFDVFTDYIFSEVKSERYIINTSSDIFCEKGEVVFSGMIKPYSEKAYFSSLKNAYLGLALD